ncbi:DUF1835 domain-containing protein [Bacillus massiliigorillae]|uniref:DUF1835 domain-containing protein n=1 Tax=Bacillus massiliigorillae TaxID=1243664 RepID=UPI00039FB94C|nr:DUF1835 domain-containing protein [Bacillus massiliigorillae]
MIEGLRKAVDHLAEQESKSLLMTILSGIDVYNEQQFFDKIKHVREELLNEYNNQAEQQVGNFHTVHFTFSRSTSGSLRQALQQMKKNNEEKVISFADLFSVGPIGRLQKQSGFVQRYDWLQNHFHHASDKLEDFFNYYTITLLAINRISEHIRIVIWSGDNAQEQTGLAYLLYLLREKKNNIIIMNVSDKPGDTLNLKHTAQIPVEAYQGIFEEIKTINPLTDDERYEYEQVWEQLTATEEKFRIMQEGKILSVTEDYYDALIMETAKKLQSELSDGEFIKAARLVGEVIDSVEEYVGEAYTEYRLRYLIKKGAFEKEGNMKMMSLYSVKLKA